MAKDDKLSGNKLYKNIGIDVDFVANNANHQNDRMNKMYWDRESAKDAMKQGYSVSSAPAAPRPVMMQTPTAQVAPAAMGESMMMDQAAMQAQIASIVDQRMMELAMKMQEFADVTDKRINALQTHISNMMTQGTPSARSTVAMSDEQTPVPRQEANVNLPKMQGRPMDGGAAAGKLEAQNKMDPSSVSIQRMFNFSNSRDGKINR